MAGESPPVLQVRDAMLDADAPCGVGLALPPVSFLVPGGSVLLELAMRRCHHASAGLRAHVLVAGVRADFHERAVGQKLGQSQLWGLSDVCATARPDRATEQHAPLGVREDHGLHRVLLGLAGDERVPVVAARGRAPRSPRTSAGRNRSPSPAPTCRPSCSTRWPRPTARPGPARAKHRCRHCSDIPAPRCCSR